ncbi:tryptophan--tRNA ligase [Leptospira yanagawae serovar Saopaulo str. Sao Paulo = ATCC 700523]|uniref:Tryptophan--tRNA ligase n=1 Tax=Leptospira yanagawae serovar Saopaulo str. Sao Paulo = ATCC 700523 TaxID=1249483 RepID=A0A5E8HCJ8_9LEPT|nr:tryptophan--tRNA ligase [Leptospira yanagawae]EOQ88503.1 tryptophan--tRNA ligase [Leptospira yanagawae serovar Saopaulo str. Sao Paulo = ATCC 700523]
MRVLTGLQPSGKLHLGNYFSAIKKILDYQSKEELFLFIANLHALTTFRSKEELKEYTLGCAIDLLALGVDPNKTVFWVQSDVPQVTELTWYLSQSITVSQLQLAHSFKDKVAKGFVPGAGLFTYPILMASDILLFSAEKIPVGRDQKQHLEFARDIAERFNTQFGSVLTIPEPDIDENTATVPGVDGAKMSKSYNNTIDFFGTEKEIKKKVMSIVSDSKAIEEPKNPLESVIFQIHSLFLSETEKESQKLKYTNGGIGYGDLKKDLLESVLSHFAPFRSKREELTQNLDYVHSVLKSGKEKAKEVAEKKLNEVRNTLGIYPF